MSKRTRLLIASLAALIVTVALGVLPMPSLEAQTPASARRAGEGLGPFKTLLIRGVMVIDGTGAPPYGPMNILVEGNRIARITGAGTPGLPGRQGGAAPAADQVIDAPGMYLLPGFIDMHVHAGGPPKNAEAEYAYKLWLAHGVTTVRGVALGGHEFSVAERGKSDRNEIVAPRIVNYQRPGAGRGWTGGAVNTPEKARDWVRWGAANGLDGLKIGAEEPSIMAALIDEAKKNCEFRAACDDPPAAGHHGEGIPRLPRTVAIEMSRTQVGEHLRRWHHHDRHIIFSIQTISFQPESQQHRMRRPVIDGAECHAASTPLNMIAQRSAVAHTFLPEAL